MANENNKKPETFSLNKPPVRPNNSQQISVDKPPVRPISHTPEPTKHK